MLGELSPLCCLPFPSPPVAHDSTPLLPSPPLPMTPPPASLSQDICAKVSSIDLYYKAIDFYIEEHPDLLGDLLRVLEIRVDHARVVDILKRRQLLPLIKEYLFSVQVRGIPLLCPGERSTSSLFR